MSKHPMWLRRGIALTLALVMTASLSVSAMAAPSGEEAGEDTVLSQTQPESQDPVKVELRPEDPAEDLEEPEDGGQGADSLPLIPLEPAEQAPSGAAAETEEGDIELAVPDSGLRFDSAEEEYVQVQGAVEIPNTVEVWIKLDEGENRRQIIMNNYGKGGTTWGIEVTTSNTLRYWDQAGPNHDYKFSDVEICTGAWMLISVVRDNSAKELRVYVDGELKATQKVSGFGSGTLSSWLCFGSDYHSAPLLLDGEIAEVRMWNDVRTDEEIAEYAGETVTGEEEGLAHAWDFRDAEEPVYRDRVFQDLVEGGVDVQAVGYAENPEAVYTVNFDLGIASDDNAPISSQAIQVGNLVTEPAPQPTKDGFTFTGWYRDASCTQKWDFANDKVTGNTTLYAGWKYDYQPAPFPEDMTGVSFHGPEDQLAMEDRLSEVPLSFEATVKLPKDLEGRGGVIIGNFMDAGYYDYDLGYVSLEVYEDGAPRLYWHQERRDQPNGGVQSVVFSGVDLRQGEWIHLAVTFDPDVDTVSCYINGILVSTVEDCEFKPVVPAQALKIGGDYRGTGGQVYDEGYNDQYFKGEIANVSVWSDVRTAEQIQADVQALQADAAAAPAEEETLLASWRFDGERDLYEDLSDRDNDAAAFVDWIDPGFAQGDYSMVALPDTQFLSQEYPDIYKKLTQWIVDHESTYNIQAVMHMGDMVNTNTDAQWKNCTDAMHILDKDKNIAWMPMRGNHDDSVWFNKAFPYAEFSDRDYFGGSYDENKLDSNCWEFSAGGRDYLVLSMGYAPSAGAIDWAENVIQENPEKNVILTAHSLMYWDGTHHDPSDLDSPAMDSCGKQLWDRLGAKYPNVVLTMGGHIGFPDVIARTDENGAEEEVTSLLCDAQGIDLTYGLGMMMLLTFHEGSDQVDVNWYSVEEGKLFRTRNQFSITVPHVGEDDGSGSGGSSSGSGGSSDTETERNPDGSTTTTETDKSTGTVTETTRYPDGSKTVIETRKDGSSTISMTKADGSASITQVDETDHMEVEVTLSAQAMAEADEEGEAVELPIPQLPVTSDYGEAPVVHVELASGETARVEISVEDVTAGTVAILIDEDGSKQIVQSSAVTEQGVLLTVHDSDVIEIVDNSKDFADVPQTFWAADAIDFSTSRGLFAGTGADMFAPEGTMNRAMIWTVLARFNGHDMAQTGREWYSAGQEWAVAAGISDGTNPDGMMTREQLAAMLYRYAGSPEALGELEGFADAGAVSGYAETAMRWAVDQGLISGMGDGILNPQGSATRAQVATILMRFIEGMA